jgi:class 3 adenylate cyclase
MFCDLVDSTDLSQHLDAEDLRSVVRAYQEAASGAIDRYAGHIAQYLGDGLLVYFGYPQAHEDDAERAVRAGLDILTALGRVNGTPALPHGVRLAARVGLHTGPVVIGEMGGGARSEVLALGATTNIAARVQGAAEPDTVVITAATQRLVAGMFVVEERGTPPLKGVATPIHAHGVLQATAAQPPRRGPEHVTPLVGRDQELGLLIARWEQAQEGDGQAVLIAGEAGLGKSRLLQAFRERLAAAPHSWLECRCTPYSQGSAFPPLIELVEQGLGFKPHDDPESKLRRLEAGLADAKLSTSEVVPLIAALLSLPLPDRYPPLRQSPELQRKQTMEALVAWTLALAEHQPLVMLYEDLHWCDPSTVELLGLLLAQSPTAQMLTLLSFRPSFAPPWPARSHVTPLAVNRLSRSQATNMIGGMTRGVPLPDAVVQRIVERADGVPLFVEEVTKMVLESDLVAARDGLLSSRARSRSRHSEHAAGLADGAPRPARRGEGSGAARRRPRRVPLRAAAQRLAAGAPRLRRTGAAGGRRAALRRGTPPATYTFKHALIGYGVPVAAQAHAPATARASPRCWKNAPRARRGRARGIARHATRLVGGASDHTTSSPANAPRSARRTRKAIGHLRRALDLVGTLAETPSAISEARAADGARGPLAAARGWSHPEYERTYAACASWRPRSASRPSCRECSREWRRPILEG